MPKFSFIIPCYGSEKTIELVVQEIQQTIHSSDPYEIILINDYSPDNVQQNINRLCKANVNIHGITFSKNFGKHAALIAGLRKAQGDFICYLDDDGQCPFPDFYRLFEKIEEGYPIAMAYYGKKKQSGFKNFGSAVNNLMANILIGKPKHIQLTNFVLMKKFLADAIAEYKGPYPYIDGLILRCTKNIAPVEMQDRHRFEGETNFTFTKMLKLWMNGFTSFSIIPLRIATVLGFLCSFIGIGILLYLAINKILRPHLIPVGWTSLIGTIVLIGGLNLFMLGILGEYVGRIFMTLSNTPQYIIEKMDTK